MTRKHELFCYRTKPFQTYTKRHNVCKIYKTQTQFNLDGVVFGFFFCFLFFFNRVHSQFLTHFNFNTILNTRNSNKNSSDNNKITRIHSHTAYNLLAIVGVCMTPDFELSLVWTPRDFNWSQDSCTFINNTILMIK